MSKLTQNLANAPFDLFQSTTTNKAAGDLGALITGADGREFRLSLSNASTPLVAGNLLQGPALVANHQGLANTAAAIGTNQIFVTLGATAATLNQYAGGYAVVTTGTGIGQILGISGHLAANSSAALTVNLSDSLVVALDSTSVVSLVPNSYNGAIQSPTTLTGCLIGAVNWAVPVSTYFWTQVHGNAGILNAGGTAIGLGITASTGTAGAFMTVTATTPDIGVTLYAATSTQVSPVFLEI